MLAKEFTHRIFNNKIVTVSEFKGKMAVIFYRDDDNDLVYHTVPTKSLLPLKGNTHLVNHKRI